MTETARSRALSRIRQVSFPGSAFASTRHAAIKKELAERLVCPHIPAGAAIYHWYEQSKDEVHVYLCHFSFDEVKPGMEIPVDPDVRLKNFTLDIDKMATSTPGDFRESAPISSGGPMPINRSMDQGSNVADALKMVANQEEPAKVKTWRDRAIEDPML